MIPSPKVATYDLKPEMSAYEVTDAMLPEINSGKQLILFASILQMQIWWVIQGFGMRL